LKALCAGDYPLADPEALSGLIRFYQLSLKAERGYATRLAADPTALFEDHLETVLAAAPET